MTHHRLEIVLRHVRGLGGNPVAELSDGDLLHRFSAVGDEAAFGEIVRRQGPMVLGVCRRLLADHHLAEDAFQATFLLLAQKARKLRQPERLGPWLYGVARRVALKARAKAAGRREVAAVDVPVRTKTEADDLRPVLDDAIARLPVRYRVPVVLCHLQGLTYAEAADRLCCPPGTVATRLNRARERLRILLLRQGVAPAAGALAAALTPDATGAIVPDDLLRTTARWAAAWAAGAAAATIPSQILTLTREVAQTMIVDKLKMLVVLAVLGVAGLGAGVALSRPAPADSPNKPDPGPVAKNDSPKPDPTAERPLPLAMLRQKPPDIYRVDAGDVLGLFIEGILGERGQIPPVINLSGSGPGSAPPAIGFPVVVEEGGTLSLPLITPLTVRGKTLNEIRDELTKVYTDNRLVAPGVRVIVSLAKPRTYRVTVVRSERFLDANGTVTLDLPAYENDILTAVAKAGGLTHVPQDAVIVIHRGSDAASKEIRIPSRIRPDQPLPFKPEDVILRNGDVLTFEAGTVPSKVAMTRAVATPEGQILLQFPSGEWKEYPTGTIVATELDGRRVMNPAERIKTMSAVLFVAEGKRPTQDQLGQAKPGTLVLTPMY